MQKPESERGDIEALKDEQWTCMKGVWADKGPQENAKDCAKLIAGGGDAKLIYPALAKEDYTVEYSKDPEAIDNTGDKSLLQ